MLSAISATVQNDTLYLESSGDFSTQQPITLAVRLPADSLMALDHFGAGSQVYIAPGFDLDSFTVNSGFGAGDLHVNNMTANSITLTLSSTGRNILTGTYGGVEATLAGTGNLYLSGVNGPIDVSMTGVSSVLVDGGESTSITGVSTGINTVQYTMGTCDITSPFGNFFQTCEQVPFVVIPVPSPTLSCGLEVTGNFTCSPDGVAFTNSPGEGSVVSGEPGSTPVTSFAGGNANISPNQYTFESPGQRQAGSVTSGGTTASSSATGTGSVSAVSVAGPSGAETRTTRNGQTTGFTTSGQETTGATQTGSYVVRQTTADNAASAVGLTCQATAAQVRVPLDGAIQP